MKKARKKEKRKAKALEEASRREEEESKAQEAAAARAAEAERKHREASARANEQAAARAEAEAAEKLRAAEAAAARQRERKQRQELAARRQHEEAEAAGKQRAAEAQAADRRRDGEADASRAAAPAESAPQRDSTGSSRQGLPQLRAGVDLFDPCVVYSMPTRPRGDAERRPLECGAGLLPMASNGLHRAPSGGPQPAAPAAPSLTPLQRQAVAAQEAALAALPRPAHAQQQRQPAAVPSHSGSTAADAGTGNAPHRRAWNLTNGHQGHVNGVLHAFRLGFICVVILCTPAHACNPN